VSAWLRNQFGGATSSDGSTECYWSRIHAGRATTNYYSAVWCLTHSAASPAASDAPTSLFATRVRCCVEFLNFLIVCYLHTMDNFDTERFIIEIQSRPSIWDNNSSDYSDRDLKKKCWEEVVDLFGGQEQTVEQKKSLGK
jgi:hypothetical protein